MHCAIDKLRMKQHTVIIFRRIVPYTRVEWSFCFSFAKNNKIYRESVQVWLIWNALHSDTYIDAEFTVAAVAGFFCDRVCVCVCDLVALAVDSVCLRPFSTSDSRSLVLLFYSYCLLHTLCLGINRLFSVCFLSFLLQVN